MKISEHFNLIFWHPHTFSHTLEQVQKIDSIIPFGADGKVTGIGNNTWRLLKVLLT